jgi:hypothetical protein
MMVPIKRKNTLFRLLVCWNRQDCDVLELWGLAFIDRWSGNFERGEIVSPVGRIASKVVGTNLVTSDARHRRPLKFLLYHPSVKM